MSKLVLHKDDILKVQPRHWNGQVFLFKFINHYKGDVEDRYDFMYLEGSVDTGFSRHHITDYPVAKIQEWYDEGGITILNRAIKEEFFKEDLFNV